MGASKYAITNRSESIGIFCSVSVLSYSRSFVVSSVVVSASESVQKSSGWKEWRLSYVLSSDVSSVKR